MTWTQGSIREGADALRNATGNKEQQQQCAARVPPALRTTICSQQRSVDVIAKPEPARSVRLGKICSASASAQPQPEPASWHQKLALNPSGAGSERCLLPTHAAPPRPENVGRAIFGRT